MWKEFVTYEIALRLKELGFAPIMAAAFQTQEDNRLIIHWYNKRDFEIAPHLLPAPLWQQVFRWLMEVHDLNVSISIMVNPQYNGYNVEFRKGRKYIMEYMCAQDYDRAMEVAINKSIEIINKESCKNANA